MSFAYSERMMMVTVVFLRFPSRSQARCIRDHGKGQEEKWNAVG